MGSPAKSTVTGLQVLNDVVIKGTLSVTGATTQTGAQAFGSTVSIAGAATLATTLAVAGAVTLSTTLAVTGASTFTGLITANGGISVKAGTGTNTYAPRGAISLQTTQIATAANTTETDGHSVTLTGNSLNGNNKAVRHKIWGTTAANGNNKTAKLYFGGDVVYTTGAVAANNKDWSLEMLVVRTGVGTQKCYVSGHFNATLVSASTIVTNTNDDETADLIIKSTLTNGTAAAADIVLEGSLTEFIG